MSETENHDYWIVFAGTVRRTINNRDSTSNPFYSYDEAEQYLFKMRSDLEWVQRGEIYHYPVKGEFKPVLTWIRS